MLYHSLTVTGDVQLTRDMSPAIRVTWPLNVKLLGQTLSSAELRVAKPHNVK